MYGLKMVHDLRQRGIDQTKDLRAARLWHEFKELPELDQQIVDQAYSTLLNTDIFRNFGSISAFILAMEVAKWVERQRLIKERKRWHAPVEVPLFCQEV